MDKALVGLMEDLDSGKAGPAFLKLMVGNMLVFGTPCSEKEFAEAFIWAETDLGMRNVRRRDRTEETRQRLAQEVATNGHPLLRMLRDASTATGDAVCLKEVTALIWTTESMTVPAMRIPIDKITAWWAGDAKFKASGGGGGWFGGVVLPLGQ